MSKIYIILVVLLAGITGCEKDSGPQDAINITDRDFLNALIESGFDKNFNKEISYTEAEDIVYLDVNSSNIFDMSGIETMVNLKELFCYNNYISELDLSENVLLESIDCSDNDLETLDFSNNPELSFINCNYNRLTSLDISENVHLKFLWCSANALTWLDISNNPELGSDWDYTANEGECYDEVDLSNMPSLQEVCVWALPFPPTDREICVNTLGSPNISYTTDCAGQD